MNFISRGELLEVSEYYKTISGNCFSECKSCYRERQQRRYFKDPEKIKEINDRWKEKKFATEAERKAWEKKNAAKAWKKNKVYLSFYKKVMEDVKKKFGKLEDGMEYDHIIPVSVFYSLAIKDFSIINIPENIRIVDSETNRRKRNKIDKSLINSIPELKKICRAFGI